MLSFLGRCACTFEFKPVAALELGIERQVASVENEFVKIEGTFPLEMVLLTIPDLFFSTTKR